MSQQDPSGGAFELRLARSGLSLTVPPESNILDEVLMAGVDVAFSCMAGICGCCRTAVMQGIPDHRDEILSPEEREQGDCIILCCSRSRSRSPVLVLDL